MFKGLQTCFTRVAIENITVVLVYSMSNNMDHESIYSIFTTKINEDQDKLKRDQ